MSKTKMRPIRKVIPLHEALHLINQAAVPIDRVEKVTLKDAGGRVLACDVVSHHDVPPFNRAAMDGYAVIAEDTASASRLEPCVLRCVEKVLTGQMPTHQVEHGLCIEIATGAPMPIGADAVVMVEETSKNDKEEVHFFSPVYSQQHIGPKGADISNGQTLLHRGDLLNPSRVGALAAIGVMEIAVFERPRVAILSTGNEIIDPGKSLGPGQIYDINKFTLNAVILEHGGLPVNYPTIADTLTALSNAVDRCLSDDILVFSGGSSVGERDLTLDIVKQKGKVFFHGIAVKPGKPTAFGQIAGKPVLGMPGYPTSCLSNAYMFLVPLQRRLAHLPTYTPPKVSLPTGQRFVSTPGRHQFYTVRIINGMAIPAFKASGDITSMSEADGYIEIPTQTAAVEKGEIVEVKLF